MIVKIMEKFDQKKYIREYKKKNYKQFTAKLPIEEKEEIDSFLDQINMNNTQFIRESYKLLKEKYKK